jgi:uncharacterized protein (TIGR02246 family)
VGPEATVDLQVEAFSRGDAEAFAATYALDAVLINMLSEDPPLCGRSAIRDQYAAMFKALPDLRAFVEGRLIVRNLVTDDEHLPSPSARAVATYQVQGNLIRRAWLLGPLPS